MYQCQQLVLYNPQLMIVFEQTTFILDLWVLLSFN